MVYIYALFDPRNPEEIRYVGKAENLVKRLSTHRAKTKYDYKDTSKSYLYNWTKKIFKEGIEFSYRILETCDNSNWADREIYWIAYLKETGHPLTNLVPGGQGSGGRKLTEEHKEILRKLRTGAKASEETLKRMSESKMGHKGTPHTPESRAKLSAKNKGRGHAKSEETKAKISLAFKGKPNNKPIGASGYKYVTKHGNTYRVVMKLHGIRKGGFSTPEEANEYVQNFLNSIGGKSATQK